MVLEEIKGKPKVWVDITGLWIATRAQCFECLGVIWVSISGMCGLGFEVFGCRDL